jgi:hypothetical protein
MRSTYIPVRGTRYYQADAAKAAGRLRTGTALTLVREPSNRYDGTAVQIRLADHTMLGYVPQERSAEFFAESAAGQIVSARIRSVRGNAPYIEIDAEIVLTSPAQDTGRFAYSAIEATQRDPSQKRPHVLQQPDVRHFSSAAENPAPISAQTTSTEDGYRWIWWVIGALTVFYLLGK